MAGPLPSPGSNYDPLNRCADGIAQEDGRAACRARDSVNGQVIERAPLRLSDNERSIGPRRYDDCRCSLSANAHLNAPISCTGCSAKLKIPGPRQTVPPVCSN